MSRPAYKYGDEYIAMRTFTDLADVAVATSAGPPANAPTELAHLGFEIEESGMYRLHGHCVFGTGSGFGYQEMNMIFYLDGQMVNGRENFCIDNSTVPARFTMETTRRVYLSEGSHYLRMTAWAFNVAGTAYIGNYAMDRTILAVGRDVA